MLTRPFQHLFWLLISIGLAIPSCFGQADSGFDTVLVCAPDLRNAADAWIEYRTSQGHQIAVVAGEKSKADIKQTIQRISQSSELKNVVIMGDAPGAGAKRGTHVETHQTKSVVIRKWGADPTFASDSYFADLDGDGNQELSIGRITADSPAQLASIVAKIIAYENNPNAGMWRRRVNFIAGVGGFGVLTDKLLETATKKFITDGIPAEFQTSMTQASWRSPYSPHPGLFRAQTIERMNEGCLAWIYLGHGRKRDLDFYRVPDGGLPIFSARDVAKVEVRQGAPIAVFLSCYAGAFDADPDCLAEELLASPSGPVAVIAGSNLTMPYAMTVMGNEMLKQLFEEQRPTLGEVLLRGKQKLAAIDDGSTGTIDRLAKMISPDPELLGEERLEHTRLFHLIGDPLLRIRYPNTIKVEAPEYGESGDTIDIQGRSPITGACVVELVCRRDRLTFRPDARPKFEMTKTWLDGLQETYAKANNSVWDARKFTIPDGEFQLALQVPENARGPAHVRVYASNEKDFAMGSSDIYLRRPAKPELTAPEPSKPADTQSEVTESESIEVASQPARPVTESEEN